MCVPTSLTIFRHLIVGTDIDALGAEVRSCFLDLRHQFGVRLRYVVESKDPPAELEEEVCAERDECPER
jgi:hypothetical protein